MSSCVCLCICIYIYTPMSLPYLQLFLFKSTLCKWVKNSQAPFGVLPPQKPESLVSAAYKAPLRYTTDVKAFFLCLIAVTLVVLKTRPFSVLSVHLYFQSSHPPLSICLVLWKNIMCQQGSYSVIWSALHLSLPGTVNTFNGPLFFP